MAAKIFNNILLVIASWIGTVFCQAGQRNKTTLLDYYSDFIELVCEMIEDLLADYLIPGYVFMKGHEMLRYAFFTFLLAIVVGQILSNFNRIFKKKVKLVQNVETNSDVQNLSKQIRALREAVSLLKQQALEGGETQNQEGSTKNASIDPLIEQRLVKNQQGIDMLRQGLVKIVEIQQDLQQSILESQRGVASDIAAMRVGGSKVSSNAKRNGGANNALQTSQADSSNQASFAEETPSDAKQNGSQPGSIIANNNNNNYSPNQGSNGGFNNAPNTQIENSSLINNNQGKETLLYHAENQNRAQEKQEIPQSALINNNRNSPQVAQKYKTAPQVQESPISQQQQPELKTANQQEPAVVRQPPPTSQRPNPNGARQPPSLINRKVPIRSVPQNTGPVVFPPS